ncbi:MAG: hypothetical protein CM15mP18_1190 [Methanobacteriota archaeon]|nr:MAG: hypothetical protein CM15mP18_1190 [Euryarchaeota archaeon]
MYSTPTTSDCFTPWSRTHRLGRETMNVEPPVTCSFLLHVGLCHGVTGLSEGLMTNGLPIETIYSYVGI